MAIHKILISEKMTDLFWGRVNKRKQKECWVWTGNKNPNGYGILTQRSDGRSINYMAHRISVVIDGRKIPRDMVVDHICSNRACVNPKHLRVVTHRQNALENSTSVTALNVKKTHCDSGHELIKENLVRSKMKLGWRVCKICAYKANADYINNNRTAVNAIRRKSRNKLKAENKTLTAHIKKLELQLAEIRGEK